METTIWILKGTISVMFLFVGVNKLILPKETLLNKGMKGLINLNETQIKFAGALEVFGVLGLLLPTLFTIYPVLSGISSIGLALTMIVALKINYQLKLSIIPNVIILIVCLFIAYWELK